MREHHIRPDGLPSPNGYSHAVAFSGRMVVVSGQTPTDAAGGVVGDDAETQTRQVFENLRTALAAAATISRRFVECGTSSCRRSCHRPARWCW
jgi:enamine deaminase RidA (YjgF/YER057c/UK114 family)